MDSPLSQIALVALAKENMHDRVVGCLFGSAVGDAIGLYTEFLSGQLSGQAYPSRCFVLHPRSRATPFRLDRHRGPHVPGDWTDDTDHAMLLLLSFLHADGKELDAADFARRLHVWVSMGLRALDTLPLGLGMTTGSIVRDPGYLEDPVATARRHWQKSGFKAAPNGSLMRTHPVGLFCVGKTIEETFRLAAAVSSTTHVDPRCVISCAMGTALVRGLVRGEVSVEQDIDAIMSNAVAWYQTEYGGSKKDDDEPGLDLAELLRHATANDLADLELDDSLKMGYVYKTLGSGICLLRQAMRRIVTAVTEENVPEILARMAVFEPLVVDLIMRGGDADTNACFAGALLGAYVGYKNLPPQWRDGLRHGDWLMSKSQGLSVLLNVAPGTYAGSSDMDTAMDGGRGFLTEKQMEERWMLLQADMARRERRRIEEEEEKPKKKTWLSRK